MAVSDDELVDELRGGAAWRRESARALAMYELKREAGAASQFLLNCLLALQRQ
jgi:hypothetical protein